MSLELAEKVNTDASKQRAAAEAEALSKVPAIPRDGVGDVIFAEPWQAEVFAMTLSLYEQGLFTWTEWAEELSTQIRVAQTEGDQDLGDTYYHHWLSALESMVVKKQIGSQDGLQSLYQRWDRAAQQTPHGQPITID